MWLMLQQDNPDDYVVTTGETHTVHEWRIAFSYIGLMIQDERFMLLAEVDLLLGDYAMAKEN
jgi:GDPmannose 4,6-dehydratase